MLRHRSSMVARKGVRKPRRRQNKRYARRNKVATLATVKRLITGTQETKCHYINPVEFTMGNNTAYVLLLLRVFLRVQLVINV